MSCGHTSPQIVTVTIITRLPVIINSVQRAQDTGAARELVVRNSLEVAIG